jgi:hypothetical protein
MLRHMLKRTTNERQNSVDELDEGATFDDT